MLSTTRARVWHIAAVGLGFAALGGCASEKAAREAELATLAAGLPGRYESEAVDRPGRLAVIPVRNGLIGSRIFYLEWTPLDGNEPRRQLLSLEVVDKTELVQRVFDFAEPPRWREALRQPELLQALVPEDLVSAGRCKLVLAASAAKLDYSCGGDSIPMRRAPN